jgi:protein-S-isoprenylcysteine O-methyltransferase
MDTGQAGHLILLSALVANILAEIWIAARDGWAGFRASLADPAVRAITLAALVTWSLAIAAAWFVTPLAIPGNGWVPLVLGTLLAYAGIALRLWAVFTLGRFFRRIVLIQDDHRVITDGPYRFVRHPSYAAVFLTEIGIGLALGNFLSIAICAAVPPLGLRTRIRVEERALEDSLSDEYRDYAAQTKRLVPGVW